MGTMALIRKQPFIYIKLMCYRLWPEKKHMDMLERSNKKFLKHILGVPDTTADLAI